MAGRRPSGLSSGEQQAPQYTLPVVRDPVWSLRPWPVVMSIGLVDYDIPALSAADWLSYLMADPPDTDTIIDDLFPDIQDDLIDGVVSLSDVYDVLLDLIQQVSGRPWWVAMRLISVCRQNWSTVGAKLILKGVNPATVSLSAWLDAAMLTIVQAMDQKDVTMFLLKLEAVPAEVQADEPEPEMGRDQFLSMMG